MYENSDIHWNTYTGTFKAFDSSGNEIKFPTDNVDYEVKMTQTAEHIENFEDLTKIEQQFFTLFEIEPVTLATWNSQETQLKDFKSTKVYPEITDRRLLKLLCLIVASNRNQNADGISYTSPYSIWAINIEDLKEEVLEDIILLYKKNQITKKAVKQVFEVK